MQKSRLKIRPTRSFRGIVSVAALLFALSAAMGFGQNAAPRPPQDPPQGALVDDVTAGGAGRESRHFRP